MEELEKVPGADLVPYEPGLPLETTIRASLVRFLPGSVISLAAVFAFLGMVPGPGEWLEAMAILALQSQCHREGVLVADLMS